MKKIDVLIVSTLVLLLSFPAFKLKAQDAPVTTGSKATGSGGTVDYSIGQVIYAPATGNTGSINQGLQQPFIIQAVTAIEDEKIGLYYQLYPNPTTDFIVLRIDKENIDSERSYYSIFNVKGELIKKEQISNKETQIPMRELNSATYLIKTFINNEEVKIFRVIKN